MPDFLQQKLKTKKGDVVLIKDTHKNYCNKENGNNYDALTQNYLYEKFDGDLVGNHNGAHYYTIGQRKGISIGGRKNPLYVLSTDVKENLVYVGEGADHPGLYRLALKVLKKKIHFVSETKPVLKNDNLKARIRYRQALQRFLYIKKITFTIFFLRNLKNQLQADNL